MRFLVTFETDACKGCELCTAWCNKELIYMDHSLLNKGGVYPASITDSKECIGCGNCALMCPDSVITIEKMEDN